MQPQTDYKIINPHLVDTSEGSYQKYFDIYKT